MELNEVVMTSRKEWNTKKVWAVLQRRVAGRLPGWRSVCVCVCVCETEDVHEGEWDSTSQHGLDVGAIQLLKLIKI